MITKKIKIVSLGMLMSMLIILPLLSAIPIQASETEETQGKPYRILFVLDQKWGENVDSILERFIYSYEWDVTTTAVNKTVTSCSFAGYTPMEVDVTLDNLTDVYMYDCVSILPGQSHENLLDNTEFHEMIQKWVSKGIIVTAWCRAVRILARADVIDGRNVTGYDGYQSEYEAAGATFSYRVPPMVDGNVITSVRSLYYQLQTCELIRTTVEENEPEFYEFSTYLGGTGDERGSSANLNFLGDTAVDSEGNIIVVGRSESDDFPLVNPYQEIRNGGIDVTVSKFYPNGTLIFSTYFGGNNHEWATGVAIDSEDNIVFAGITGSENFPLMNPYQSENNGGIEGNADCYVTKLSSDGQTLLYSTYFGGTGSDWCYEMNVDDEDRIGITGTTESSNLPLLNPYQPTRNGNLEAFVTVFEADGQSLAYSTYLGSSSTDHGRGLDFDAEGNLYLTGIIYNSTHGTIGSFQPEFAGFFDSYLAIFNITGGLNYFSYLGGDKYDRANDLVLDSAGNILITGYTSSTDFPVYEAYQNERVGAYDIFVVKMDPTGKELLYSTFYGGEDSDEGYAISCNANGTAIITGLTYSEDFPTTHTPYPVEDDDNGFILTLNPDGFVKHASLIGGEGVDLGVGVAWCSNFSYVVTGFTNSEDLPIYHAVQGEFGGVVDMFVMKVNITLFEIPDPEPDLNSLPPWAVGTITVSIIGALAITTFTIVLIKRKRLKKS